MDAPVLNYYLWLYLCDYTFKASLLSILIAVLSVLLLRVLLLMIRAMLMTLTVFVLEQHPKCYAEALGEDGWSHVRQDLQPETW